jgi:hypothetical protein
MEQPVKIEFVQTVAEVLIKESVNMENASVKKDLLVLIAHWLLVQMNALIKENALMDFVFAIKDMEEQIAVKLHVQIIAPIMELAIKL